MVMDVATGVGYNFTSHFGVDLGVPYYFIGTPASIKQKNPNAVSGNGIGGSTEGDKFSTADHRTEKLPGPLAR